MGSEEEREGKGDEKKRMKGKQKKWKGKQKEKGKKQEIKDYKCSLHRSVLDRLNKQLFTEGGNAYPL